MKVDVSIGASHFAISYKRLVLSSVAIGGVNKNNFITPYKTVESNLNGL